MLVGEGKFPHSYPHCWRCHNPVIFRATEQWFIRPASRGKSFARHALAEIKKVKWKPAWGEERMHNMIVDRPDWCISRQRFWGVPLVIFYCDGCGKSLRISRRCATCFRFLSAKARMPGTRILPKSCFRRARSALPAARRNGAKKATFSMCGLIPDPPTRRAAEAGGEASRGYLPGRSGPISRMVPELVAGRCGVDGMRPYEQVVTHGWTLDEKGRADVEVAGQCDGPEEICESGARTCCASGCLAGLHGGYAMSVR